MNVEIPELVPKDDYDARQARLESSMRWLLSKACGESVPSDYQEAFFSSGLSSVLSSRLTSSELYWAAASTIFPEVKGQTQQGHTPLIQLLVRRGIYLSDVNSAEIDEKLLQCASPIHLMAHLTLLEGFMTAYINSTLTPEKVVPAVRKFSTFSASSELPMNAEDAAMFWVNKTCAALCHHLRELNPSACPQALSINDIRDVCDGRCLAAVVSFYCPQELSISEIELGDSLAIADSLYNLQQMYSFCRRHLSASLLTLTVMDLFYAPEILHLNVLTFYADLFHCLEVERVSCVRDTGQPLTFSTNATEPKLHRTSVLPLQPSPQLNRVVIPQISDPTKRSFLQSVSTNHTRPQSSTANGTRQSIMSRRHSDAHSADVSSFNSPRQPITDAWVPNNAIQTDSTLHGTVIATVSSGGSLLSNVAIDDSIDLSALDSRTQSCDDEVETLLQATNENISRKPVDRKRIFDAPGCHLGPSQSSASSAPSDRLLPAQLRPSKEKFNNHSKKCEYSEKGGRKKYAATTPDDNVWKRPEMRREASDDSGSSSTPIEGYKTPPLGIIGNNGNGTKNKETALENNGFTLASSNFELGNDADSKQVCRNRFGGQSYVVRGRPTIVDDALAADLSVVGLDGSSGNRRGITSGYGSSNDGSDQELHKLRADSRDKEFKGRNGNKGFFVSLGTDSPRPRSSTKKPLDKGMGFDKKHFAGNGSSKTSFAQIKRQAEADEISKGLHDLDPAAPERSIGNHLMGAPLLARPHKKTMFGALPNQTTWVQESDQRVSEKTATSTNEDAVQPMPSDLIGLRLKLEENRRQIENRKRLTERQWHKQRQQMGKEAFIQVIKKNKHGGDLSGDEKSSADAETLEIVNQNVLQMSDERKLKVGTLPKRQSPFSKTIIQKCEDRFHDDINKSRSHASNDEADILQKVDAENPLRGVDPGNSPQVIRTGFNSMKENADEAEDGAEASTHCFHSSADIEEQEKYDDSLDRINSSLTELQGEIQRLSRQQDHINNMVRSEVNQSAQIAMTSAQELRGDEGHRTSRRSRPMHETTTPTKDEVFVHHLPSAGETLTPGIGASALPVGAHSFLGTETPLHQSRPSALPYSVPSYPAMGTPFPPRYQPTPSVPLSVSQYHQPYSAVPPVSMPADRMYLPVESGHQFVALAGQFHPSSGMYPMVPGMYPVSVPTSYGHYQQYPHMQDLSTLVPRHEFPPALSPRGMPFAEYSPQHSSFSSQPLSHAAPVSLQSFAAWPGSEQVQGMTYSTFGPSEPQNSQPARSFAPIQAGNNITGQEHGMNEGSDTWKILENAQRPPSVQDLGDAGQAEVHPPSGGFFVNLGDSSTPTRQRPNLTRLKAKSKGGGDDALTSDQVTSGSTSPAVVEPHPSPRSQTDNTLMSGSPEMSGNSETSPLVFVIGQSTENEDDWLEMERRKQRLCELQTKRQEEQELRREKLQKEQERKREHQRVKQELTEQKRSEEKSRREAIYQTYLRKKKEKETYEDSPSKPVPPVIRRQRSTLQRATRPNSQPVLPAKMVPVGGGTVGHSSHDNLTMEGVAAKTPASHFSQSNEKVNSAQSEVPLVFGGLTHRRPPTPDQNIQIVQPTSDGSESSGSQLVENYTGPKLFVKPSQKSNRNIIINAISHCCLAGSVNRDVKDKVLEEITKSDAKHFIILFRDAAMQYRGLYTYNPEQEEILRIHGVGPRQLTDKVMEKFYKYNSGSKKFSEVTSTKHLTATIDAITVLGAVWQKMRSAALSKKPV